jgi:hypothetical protein
MPTTLTLTTPDGQSAQVLHVPTRWLDVTLAQFVALHAPADGEPRTAAELLLGLEAGALGDLHIDEVQYFTNLLAFAADPSPVLELLPTPGLPDVGSQPYGCLVDVQQHLAEAPGRPWLAYGPYLLALYRVQVAYGRYDASKVAACEDALLAAPVTECYGDMAHFIGAWQTWLNATPQTQPTTVSLTTLNLRRTPSRRWLKGLGLCWPWTWPQGAPS